MMPVMHYCTQKGRSDHYSLHGQYHQESNRQAHQTAYHRTCRNAANLGN
jgi:hypothetical protein